MNDPIKIPKHFTANKLFLNEIRRDGMVALYSTGNRFGQIYGYEVVIIRVDAPHPAYERGGKTIPAQPAKEHYPNNEEFGKLGWSYPNDLEVAIGHYKDILDAQRELSAMLQRDKSPIRDTAVAK